MRLFPYNSHTLSKITSFHSMWFLQDTSSPYQGKRNYHRAYKNLPALQMIRTFQFANCTFPIMHLVCTFCVIIVPREIEDKGCVKFWGRGGGANKVYYGRCSDGELGFDALSCSFIRSAREWSHTFHYQNLLHIAVHYMFKVT